MFLFNSDSGEAVTARIEEDGSLSPLNGRARVSAGQWTHVGSDGQRLVFFDQVSGSGTTAAIDELGMVSPLPIIPSAAFGDWTNIAANTGRFMLYNALTNEAATGLVEAPQTRRFEFRRRFQLALDRAYTDVVPAGWSDHPNGLDRFFLFFNRVNGTGITYRVDNSGGVTVLDRTEVIPPPSSEGWSHIAAHNNEGNGRLYFFDNDTRSGTTAEVDTEGRLRPLKQNVDNFQHCTHIADGNRLLCYDRTTGQATTVEVDADGNLRKLRELGPLGDFSHIVM